VIWHTHKITTN